MVRHRPLSTQTCPVVPNGSEHKFLGDIIIVPGVWTTFMLGELLCLDNGCLWTIFIDGFLSPLGMDITSMSTEVLVWMTDDNMTYRLVESVTISSELICSEHLLLLCLTDHHSDEKSSLAGPASSSCKKTCSACP